MINAFMQTKQNHKTQREEPTHVYALVGYV